MKIPEGMTENEVVEVINNIANRLASKFKFGYHSLDDMKQQARLHAWEALDKYDGIRPLENFLYKCVHNSLFNFKRNNFQRPNKPCLNCPLSAYDPDCRRSESGCTEYSNLLNCDYYAGWIQRNEAKKNIMSPIELGGVRDEREKNMKVRHDAESLMDTKEIIELIQQHIPLTLRADWLKMRYNIKVPKQRREKVKEAISDILEEHEIDVQKTW